MAIKGLMGIDTKYGHKGVIEEVYDNWEDLKAKSSFITIDPDRESEEMDYTEKIIKGDPKDEWLKLQEKPFTEEQLQEKWYTLRCIDGGAVWVCESNLVIESDNN